MAKSVCVLTKMNWVLRELQIEEDGKLRQNMDYFLDLMEYRDANPDKCIPDAEIIKDAGEHFMLLQGKKLSKARTFFVDELGMRKDSPTVELMREREKQVRLKYCDNYFTRYAYYSFTGWLGRIKAFFTGGTGSLGGV